MTDTQTIEAINAHLDECPTDWTARLQLADLYEGAGREDEARYQRWAVQWEKAPEIWPGRGHDQHPWHWWAIRSARGSQASRLGILVRRSIASFQLGSRTRQDAEADLMLALIAQGWPAPGVE